MPLLLFLLLAALGMDRQGAGVDGDLDVLVRVQAGELGPDDEGVVLDVVRDPERLSRRERQQGRQRRLQPVQQLREYGGCLTARQLGHDVLLLLRWSCLVIRRPAHAWSTLYGPTSASTTGPAGASRSGSISHHLAPARRPTPSSSRSTRRTRRPSRQ